MNYKQYSFESEVLLYDDVITPGFANLVADHIYSTVTNHKIYEHSEHNKLIPVIDPTIDIISKPNVKPISKISWNFLNNIYDYLKCDSVITIKRE